ncbi:MAG TPA: hypothetical protein PLS49_01760 [Candidatus Woesebacteria bacterium]|nr:hypothetical protein [Candidatus Woesebacteria bacterium]
MQLLRRPMFPIILLAHNPSTFDSFIKDFQSQHGFYDLQKQIILPEKTTITIGQIRNLKKELSITTSKPRLIIFQQFEKATIEAQNALLKVLEDLNTNNQFIMYVNHIGAILPTIISRSKVIDLVEEKTIYDEQTVTIITQFLEQPSVSYLSNAVFSITTKEQATLLLTICIEVLREHMKDQMQHYPSLIKKTFDLLYKLEHNNLSPQLTVDNWILLVIKTSKK